MGPTISVIVPIYNVEPYLAPCLNSIARQSYPQLQVVMVDDGSTDGSGGIAKEFAARDDRFLLVQQENKGLGAARNTGIDRAIGEFLVFVDSDDVLPQEACALWHASAAKSGSDFVTGVVRRFGALSTYRTALTPFRRNIRRTHIRDEDDLLMDRIVTNKLWRRSFWDAHGLRFPEGVLYEDVLVALSAHVMAEAVDVVRETVYWWRTRTESITKRRAVPEGIRDRAAAVHAVREFMSERGFRELRHRYERVALATELRYFVDVADQGTSDYRTALAAHIGEYLRGVDPTVLDELPAVQRLKYHLIARGLTDELLDVLAFHRTERRDVRALGTGEERYAVYPYFDDPRLQIPRDVYRLRTELAPRCAIHRLRWAGRTLKLTGYAYIDRIDAPDRGAVETVLVIRDRETGSETEIPTRSIMDREATLIADQGRHCYDGAGFTATIDLSSFEMPPDVDATFDVEARVRSNGVERRGVKWKLTHGGVERAGRASLGDDRTIRAQFNLGRFSLHVERLAVVVDLLSKQGEELLIGGYLVDPLPQPKSLRVRRRVGATFDTDVTISIDHISGRRAFETKVSLSMLSEGADAARAADLNEPVDDDMDADVVWQVRMRLEDDTSRSMVVDTTVPTAGLVHNDREFTLHRTRHQHLALVERRLRPLVTRARWRRGPTLVLSALQPFPDQDIRVVLKRHDTGHERSVAASIDGRSVTITLPLDAMDDAGEPRVLPRGTWDLLVEREGLGETRIPLRAHVDVIDRLESSRVRGGHRYALRDRFYGSLTVEAGPARPIPRPQMLREQQRAPVLATKPLRPHVVVFSSWQGRRCAGDVRAIYEALSGRRGIRPVWVGRDSQIRVPRGRVVELGTREHVEALSRAALVVTDHLLPAWWQRPEGQRVVQTWHGTPVRRAALHLPDDQARAGRWCLDELRRQSAEWDVLISASPAATAVLRETTGFSGTALEAGAPRCDIHHRAAQRTARATQVRTRLGLREDTRVVLWAPTARDDGWSGRRRQQVAVNPDAGSAPDVLGRDTVVLVHRHPAIARPVTDASGVLRDVTGVHDVADLLVIADVLVTDYSSVVLDFLHTGRPVVLFMPDLDEFTTTGPGFAVDLLATPPGPVATGWAEALEDVAVALNVNPPHDGYDRLLSEYGGARDGAAADRVAQHILDRTGSTRLSWK